MENDASDPWRALVSAEREVSRLRAALGSSGSRGAIIDRALAKESSAWDKLAALNFLKVFNRDAVSHVRRLFHLALSERWEGVAREVLAAGPRAEIVPAVIQYALASLPASCPEDYLRLSALLSSLEAKDALAQVTADALANGDSEIIEAGQFIREFYRPFGLSDSEIGSEDE